MKAGDLLREGFSQLSITCNEKQIDAFLDYLEELKKWNKLYNLTALKTDHDIIVKHFLDSALFCKVLPAAARSVADIGSGAGFPGIPMGILIPELRMILIEPTQKKALFLRHISHKLNLAAEVINRRIEDIQELTVDVAVTRALFTIREFVGTTERILTAKGVLILNKGPKLKMELQEYMPERFSVKEFQLPFLNARRHLVVVEK